MRIKIIPCTPATVEEEVNNFISTLIAARVVDIKINWLPRDGKCFATVIYIKEGN